MEHAQVMSLVTLPLCVAQAGALLTTLLVTERFESKHLPVEVQIGGRSENSVPKHDSPSHIEKLIWDDNKRPDFEENVRKEQFVEEINRATISLRLSVDEAVKRLSECLLKAAHCMGRNVYKGPRQSVWFYCECKTLKRELRKWYRKFRRAESGACLLYTSDAADD